MKTAIMRSLKLLKQTIGALAIFGGILTIGSIQTAHADTNDMGFTVQPSEQNYAQIGYFKFSAQPKETEKLNVLLTNTSNQKQKINIEIKNALSSPAGNTQYTTKTQIKNSKLLDPKRAMKQYVSGPSSVELAPQEKKNVEYIVKLPAKDQVSTGTLLGGLSFENASSPTASTQKSPVTVFTKMARLISIEADYDQTKSNVSLNSPSISTNPSMPLILLPIKNDSPAIVRDMKLDYTVQNSNHQTIFEHHTNDKQTSIMAPSTKIKYMIPWRSKTFKPGNYTIQVHLKTRDQDINKTFSFDVKNQNVKNYAKQSKTTPIVKEQTNWLLIASLVGIIVILLIALIRKQHKKADSEKNE